MPSLALLQRHLWVSSRKLAEKHLGHARQLLSSQEPADIHSALGLLDTALKLFPQWEKAIELKARALLCLRRFKDVANLLHESIPSFKANPTLIENPAEDKIKLLPTHPSARKSRKAALLQCFSLFPLQKKVWVGFPRKGEREQWKYIVLGQACCHLGMMEDAMILLSNGKRAASAACRKQSSCLNEDSFFADSVFGADSDLVSHLLGNIKLLLRRRTAALAALEAGLYAEAARHFSKIIDGRRGTPQGFIAECYMHRAVAYQAANKVIDAIADCNRSFALNPMCAEALSMRATLYETIGCFSDSLKDLEQLKGLYETVFRNNLQWVQSQNSHNSDLQGCIDFISNRSASIRERVNVRSMVDYHRVLGVSRGCSRAEIERSYLLLSLKHRPDKAAHFVDRCEFVDERDIEAVKDEARTLGFKLFRLLQRAYTWAVSLILEEEMKRDRIKRGVSQISENFTTEGSLSLYWRDSNPAQHVPKNVCLFGSDGEAQSLLVEDTGCCANDEAWLTPQEGHQIAVSSSVESATKQDVLESHPDIDVFSNIESFGDVGQLVDASLFAQTLTCRELANVGTILSQSLPSEAWIGSNDWNHQGHSPHPLSVT